MIIINCSDKVLGDLRFGPVYAGKPNYDFYIVKCSNFCGESGNINAFGQYVHPEESGICKSAIVDNAMPLTGGVVGVGIGVGLPLYPAAKETYGIKIVEHAESAKSFYTFKIDNIDMAMKDIRIVDDKGKISHKGRVEMRLNGRWGSICKK